MIDEIDLLGMESSDLNEVSGMYYAFDKLIVNH